MRLLEVMPDSVRAYREYLGTIPELTTEPDPSDRVPANRIYYGRLTDTKVPLPAIRVTEITDVEATRHAWSRSLLQFDVWHSDGRQPDCRRIAQVVRAALVASPGYTRDGWVLGGPDDVVSVAPFGPGLDDSFNPPVPRYVVTASLLIRPN